MSSLLLSIPSPCRGTVQSASYHSVVDYVRPRLPAAALTMLVMLALKRHYSLATADELNWVLAPTAMLVRWLTSANPVLEDGIDYADFANGIIVAPACAGVNFMIMAFGLAGSRMLSAGLNWAALGQQGVAERLALIRGALRHGCISESCRLGRGSGHEPSVNGPLPLCPDLNIEA